MDYENIQLEIESGVATLTIDRPKVLNALNERVAEELCDVLAWIGEHGDVRAVLLRGEGRAFCSGGDVEDIIGPLFERDREGLLEFTTLTCDLIAAIRVCRRPIVAALNGTVAGAGAVIASACDIRIADPKAKIAFMFTKVGLSGADMGIAWILPRLIGLGRATELLMTGDFITAEEAHRIGLYNHLTESGESLAVALKFATDLAQGPSLALAVTKDALNREASMDVLGALEAEAGAQADCMLNPNFREAYEAFMAKRPADYA